MNAIKILVKSCCEFLAENFIQLIKYIILGSVICGAILLLRMWIPAFFAGVIPLACAFIFFISPQWDVLMKGMKQEDVHPLGLWMLLVSVCKPVWKAAAVVGNKLLRFPRSLFSKTARPSTLRAPHTQSSTPLFKPFVWAWRKVVNCKRWLSGDGLRPAAPALNAALSAGGAGPTARPAAGAASPSAMPSNTAPAVGSPSAVEPAVEKWVKELNAALNFGGIQFNPRDPLSAANAINKLTEDKNHLKEERSNIKNFLDYARDCNIELWMNFRAEPPKGKMDKTYIKKWFFDEVKSKLDETAAANAKARMLADRLDTAIQSRDAFDTALREAQSLVERQRQTILEKDRRILQLQQELAAAGGVIDVPYTVMTTPPPGQHHRPAPPQGLPRPSAA